MTGLEARVPPPHERALRRATITALLNECAPPETIIEECEKKFGMSSTLTREWIARIKSERSEQFEQDRGKYKAEQVARLQADLTAMRRMKAPPYATIARFEELLIRIVGTAEPVRIENTIKVSVRESIIACIQHMDDDVLDTIAAEQLELEATAKSARALMGMGALDTVGSPVVTDAGSETSN